MNTKGILTAAIAMFASATLSAQVAGGRLITLSNFTVSDMMNLARYDYTMGTARSAAMGGAFSSLGGDLSSMVVNPAGLGMYRSSEFSFSPSMTWTRASSYSGAPYSRLVDNGSSRFTLGNIGVALNTFQSTGALTSFTFGFGYTKLADFNYSESIGLGNEPYSITDIFASQLTSRGYPPTDLMLKPWNNYDIPTDQWGAVLGYRTQALGAEFNSEDGYYDYYSRLADGALTQNGLDVSTQGCVGEYSIAGGMNFNNRFYFGFALGLQDIYYRQYIRYAEIYTDNDYPLDYLAYGQSRRFSGSGVNFKLGAIFRPIDPLRLSVAICSPTFVSLESSYEALMDTHVYNQSDVMNWHTNSTNTLEAVYQYVSPTRLTLGASYQVGNFAIISADYERSWYNGMRLSSSEDNPMDSEVRDYYKDDIKYAYKGADNLRLGIELRPIESLSLRAGYNYSGSGVKSDKDLVVPASENCYSVIDNPVQTSANSFSCGVGYRLGGLSVDAAYVFTKSHYTPYSMYWWGDAAGTPSFSETVSTSMKRSLATLTFGFRF